jgi:hypothetical protein
VGQARKPAGGWSVTPLGVVLLVILVAAAVLAGVGSSGLQTVGFLVLVLDAAILIGSGLSGGEGFGIVTGKNLRARRAEFGPRSRRSVVVEAEHPDEIWRRERERREQREREERSRDIGLS